MAALARGPGAAWSVGCRLVGPRKAQAAADDVEGVESEAAANRLLGPSSPRARSPRTRPRGASENAPRARWKCASLEAERTVIIQQRLGPEESLQRVSGFDKVFREQVTEEVVFQRFEEPLLNDVWNGADTCAVECGAIREKVDAVAASLQRPLEYLFSRINDATDTAASVLRFKVFLSVLYVYPDQVVDALAPAPRRLQLGSDGAVHPQPSAVQIDSAAEGLDRIVGLHPPPRARAAAQLPVHAVLYVRLERWVRSRKRGLLTPDRDRISLRDMGPPPAELLPESTDDWTVTTSTFRKVRVHLVEAQVPGGAPKPTTEALGAHASAHSHKLHRDVAQTLTSFCRCLREDGASFRDAKLTHVLKPVFLEASRCTLTAYVETPSDSYCRSAGPLRFAERALRAVRARQAAPRVETESLEATLANDSLVELDDGSGFRHEGLLASLSSSPRAQRRRNGSFASSIETKLERGSEGSRPGTAISTTRAFERSRTRVLDILQDLRKDLDLTGLQTHETLDSGSARSDLEFGREEEKGPMRAHAEAPRFKAQGISTFDDDDLAASREALRQQLARFQVEKELLAKAKGPALVTDESKEAVGDLVQRLEDERRQALEKGRGLMQQVWQLEAEKGDAQRKARVLQERVDILEADRDAQEANLPQWRARHESQVEALKEQHATEIEQMRRDEEARVRKLRAELAEHAAQAEAARGRMAAQERKRAQDQLDALEVRHKDELKALRDRAEDREAAFRQRLKDAQAESRKHIEQATLNDINRDRIARESQEAIADAEATHQQELDRLRAEIEEERADMEQFRAEERDRAEQALRDLELERKLRQEREVAHRDAAAAAQRRISALQDDVSRLSSDAVTRDGPSDSGARHASGQSSALVARVQHSEEVTRLRRAAREREADLQRALANLEDERTRRGVLEDDIARYRTQLAARDEENRALKVVSGELSAAHEEACHDLEAASGRVEALERELDAKAPLEAQLVRAERELINLRENLEDAQSSLDAQDRRVAEAETRAVDLASRLRDTERHLEDVLADRDRALDEAAALRDQLLRAEEDAAGHSRAIEELATLRERLRTVEAATRSDYDDDGTRRGPSSAAASSAAATSSRSVRRSHLPSRYPYASSPSRSRYGGSGGDGHRSRTPRLTSSRRGPPSTPPSSMHRGAGSSTPRSAVMTEEEVIERAARAAADHTVASLSNVLNRSSHLEGSPTELSDTEEDPIRDALAKTLRDKEAEVKQLKRRIDALAHTNITFV